MLTNDGLKHPVTILDGDTDRNIDIWKNLPELDGCNIATQLKPDAVPLAIYPTKGILPLFPQGMRDLADVWLSQPILYGDGIFYPLQRRQQ